MGNNIFWCYILTLKSTYDTFFQNHFSSLFVVSAKSALICSVLLPDRKAHHTNFRMNRVQVRNLLQNVILSFLVFRIGFLTSNLEPLSIPFPRALSITSSRICYISFDVIWEIVILAYLSVAFRTAVMRSTKTVGV